MSDLNRYLLSEIALLADFEHYTVMDAEGPLTPKRLPNLGKINVFVGANNSGKSRLIRNLAKAKELVFEPPEDLRPLGMPVRDMSDISVRVSSHLSTPSFSVYPHLGSIGLEEPLHQISKLQFQGLSTAPRNGEANFRKVSNLIIQARESVERWINRTGRHHDLADKVKEVQSALDLVVEHETAAHSIRRVYIPTIRTLRELGNQELFQTRTAEDYKIDKQNVFTGQSLYEEVEALLRGNLYDRETLRSFEEWLSKDFFEGKPVAIIPRIKETTLTVKIGDEEERPIHDLGDGIQALLILTFPLFLHRDAHLVAFMEEPELFMHPWLQRAFLEMLSSRFPKHQYFFTTHSNHFLDLTLDLPDVSVFTLEKQGEEALVGRIRPSRFVVRQVSHDDRKPLELLGVRNSSVFLSNCTIWVEGITDRRYIAHWLKLYQALKVDAGGPARVFKEDLHYSFVEYGGGNITHFSFLDDEDESEPGERGILVDRLCSKLFLITDADGDKKKERKEKLTKRLGERYFCLPGREIENLIKPEMLQRVLAAYGEAEPPLFTHTSYLKEKLGKYIDDKLGTKRERKGSYADRYGVLKNKVSFCEKVVEATRFWEDVSEQAQAIVRRLHEFIDKSNPR